MDLVRLIQHPELMNKDTLYELRSIVALYPYYQAARLLMLQNMYLLHDTSFDDELRRAAMYITDRTLLFELVEGSHYKIKEAADNAKQNETTLTTGTQTGDNNRTISIIDNFLESATESTTETEDTQHKSKPTPADAAVDYVAYLLKSESEQETHASENSPQLKGQSLIDNFINKDGGKIQLQEKPVYRPELDSGENTQNDGDENCLTETLAQIYIKQKRYSKALEIIQRLNLNYPKKSAYFADQIRFLKKLIANEKAARGADNTDKNK